MAEKRSDVSRWPSKYSPDTWVTGAQYILELVCENRAAKNGTNLPIKFWDLPEWAALFKSELIVCHRLLKKYCETAVIKVVKSKGIYTLRAKWIEPIISKEHAIILKNTQKMNQEKKKDSGRQKPTQTDIIDKRPYRNTDNSRSKLFDLDE